MSSTDFFLGLKDLFYWLFQNTLEPTGELFWMGSLLLGFVLAGYWMYRQVQFNKMAENDPNQIK